MAKASLSNAHKKVLAELYQQAQRNRDDLPYTEEFERLYTDFVARTESALSRHEVWKARSNAAPPIPSQRSLSPK